MDIANITWTFNQPAVSKNGLFLETMLEAIDKEEEEKKSLLNSISTISYGSSIDDLLEKEEKQNHQTPNKTCHWARSLKVSILTNDIQGWENFN